MTAAGCTSAPDADPARRTFDGCLTAALNRMRPVIYCVVPEALAEDLLGKLSDYYADDPNVTVIVNRRKSSRREAGSSGGGKRAVRDRRRARVAGEIPELASD
jgi:hypothetical protein